MENNNYLSSGVNYIPLTVLDKSHSVFINENGGAFDLGTKQGTKVGSSGRYCFGLGAPTQFFWENDGTYDQAGIKYTEGDSGVFVNNTGDRGISVWLYFGDNYNPGEAVSSVGEGSEGYTDPSAGQIGYWQRYTYILPNQNATIPWIMDDEVGAQSTRMYFQYASGYVPGTSLEDWDGTGGLHNQSWAYNNAPTGNVGYGVEDLLPITYENLSELETISSNEGLDGINLMCMSVTGALLIDSTPSNYTMEKDVLILNTAEDIWVDNMTAGDMFDNKLWGPVSSQYFEIDDLTYATQSGIKIAIGDELTRVVSGDAQAGSHFLLNGLEIKPSSVSYNSSTQQTTFVVPITFPAGSEGGAFEVEKFEHYFSRVQSEVITGFVEGSLMVGAKVTARGKGGDLMTVYTDANGQYTFPEPVIGDIIATGGTNSITNETVHDPSNEDVVESSDLTTTRAPFKTNATLGGIVNAQSTLIVDLMKNHNMNRDAAVDAFIDAGKTLYDLDSSVTRQQLNTYLKVGMVGLQNSDSDDTTLYAEMLKTNKAISELEEGFTNGGTSDNATLKEKRKAAVQLRRATADIISSASKNKLTENANGYLTIAGSDSNLGTIGTNASDTSKNDMLYLINAKAIEDLDSKLTSTAKNLSSKADWKQAAATIVAAVSEKPFKSKSELAVGISYEEIFMHYNESAMRRKAGSNKVYDKKRLGLTPSKTDFINEADNVTNFRISIVDGNYQTTGSVTDARGNTKAVSKTGSTRYSNENMAEIKSEISKNGKTYEIVRQGGKLVEVEKTTNQLVVWGTGFARATYITGPTLSPSLHSFNDSELLINTDEFMLNSKNERWNGAPIGEWMTNLKFEGFYPDLIGQNDGDVHASLFKPSYKFVIGNHIKVKDENGQLRTWNIVDFKTGRAYAEPGSQEEFDLLEIINQYAKTDGLTGYLVESIDNIVNASSGLRRDTDGDGVADGNDAFPNDPTEWGDRDGDGVGDRGDVFPNDPTETSDTDGDGVGDKADLFPNDPSKSEHTPFAYTIDTTLAGDSLTQRFGTGLYHNLAAQTPVSLDNDSKKIKIDWGEGAGWEYYGSGDSVQGRNLYNTQRYNFEHTYTEHGTYQIRVSFEDVIEVYPNVLTQILPQGIGGWSYSIGATDWAKRVTSIDSWGDTNTVRLFTPQGLYIYLENCQSWPSVDNLPIVEVLADAYHAPFIPSTARVIADAKYLTSFNASDWNWTTGSTTQVVDSGRYFYRWDDADRLQTLNLDNLEYDSFSNAYFDNTGYFGSLVPNGTLVGFNNVTIDNGDTNPNASLIYYLQGRIHKDSTFNNVSINNSGDFGWRTSITGGAHIITDESSYTYQQKNWIDTSGASKKLKVIDLPYFQLKDSSGNARTSGVDVTVDLSSPNGWELSGSMQDKWPYGPISQNHTNSLTIVGTDNWDTSGVTSWYRFFLYLNSSVEVDMDISSWSFEGSPSFRLINLKSEQYTKALIAWAASEPSYSATINMGVSQYNQTAHAAKMSLINDYGWTFTDAGLVFDSNETMPTNFVYNATAQANSDEACSLEATSDTAYFFPSSGEYPVVGDWIFTSLNGGTGGTAIIEGSGTYKIESEAAYSSHITLDGMGKVTGIGDCSAPEPSSVQYNYGNASRDTRDACSVESLAGTFYVAEEIGEAMPPTLYSDAALTEAIDFSRSADGYYPFQLNGSSTRKTFNLSRGRFGAVSDCR